MAKKKKNKKKRDQPNKELAQRKKTSSPKSKQKGSAKKSQGKKDIELKIEKKFLKKLVEQKKQVKGIWLVFLGKLRNLFVTISKKFFAFWRLVWKSFLHLLKICWFIIEIAGIISLGLMIVLAAYSYYYHDKFVPRTHFLQHDLSGITYEQATKYFVPKLAEFESENFKFVAANKNYFLSPADLGIEYDLEASLQKAFSKGHNGNFWQRQGDKIWALFSSNETALENLVDLNQIKQSLKELIPEIAIEPRDAEVIVNQSGEFEVLEGQKSISTDFVGVYNKIRNNLESFKTETIQLEIREFEPEISTNEAQIASEKAALMLTEPIQLLYEHAGHSKEFWIPLPQDKYWISFEKQQASLVPVLNEIKLKTFLIDELGPKINKEHSNAYIKEAETSITDQAPKAQRVKVEGFATDGFDLKIAESLHEIVTGFADGKRSIALVVEFKPGLILDEAERDLGLHELIGIGASDFKGSDANRAYNVAHGTALFNNILIPPGGEFSFNAFMGEVSGRTGWKLAKVIRGNGYIEPDWGGGACQVSTTAYRAILDAGLEVTERSPHSLYVSYYTWGPYNEQNDGTGLDATVFLGVKDLKFRNDSPAHILMQTKIEGTKAYFYLYGTKDREVTFDGPHRGAWYASGAAPILEETDQLPPGKIEIIQKALSGFRVYWTQSINFNDGRVVENRIDSNYRATPAFGRIGKSVVPQTGIINMN